jgi:type VI protein secretion system component Hcp
MSNSVAEAYLLIFRSSMVPIVGEAVPIPFNEQIELDEWHWTLKEPEGQKAGGKKPASAAASDAKKKEPAFKGDELIRAVGAVQTLKGVAQPERDKRVRELIQKAAGAQAKADKDAGSDKKDDDDENKLEFSFGKGVDLASTQLLNSMKTGEVLPRAVVTLYHRSSNAPVSLVVTFGDVVLTNYKLSVDVSETMADLKEDWTATFKTVDYIYKNRPAAAGSNRVTQGTARIFKKNLAKGLGL